MQYSPRVRSPLSTIDNNAAASAPSDNDFVFKKPTAPPSRLARPDGATRERSGSSAGICTMPSRLTRSTSSIEQLVQTSETRRVRNALQTASNAVPIPEGTLMSTPAPPPSAPVVTVVARFTSPPSSSFNMTALDQNLPVASGNKSLAPSSPDSPDQSMDFEKIPVFPVVSNSDVPDFPCISADTLADLLRGAIPTSITRVILIDCRFEYEYTGGHVKSAINLHTEELVERVLTRSLLPDAEHLAIIFYCEFSSYRGPRLCRFLRSWDRKMNLDRYPRLHYDNLFVLKGGYKNFYATHPELCYPQSYLPMSDPRYAEQCSAGLASCKKPRPTRSYSWSGLSQPMF